MKELSPPTQESHRAAHPTADRQMKHAEETRRYRVPALASLNHRFGPRHKGPENGKETAAWQLRLLGAGNPESRIPWRPRLRGGADQRTVSIIGGGFQAFSRFQQMVKQELVLKIEWHHFRKPVIFTER